MVCYINSQAWKSSNNHENSIVFSRSNFKLIFLKYQLRLIERLVKRISFIVYEI